MFVFTGLVGIVNLAFRVMQLLVLVYALSSWVPDWRYRRPPWIRSIDRIIEPLIRPIQRVLNRYNTGGMDFSPLILMLLLDVARGIVVRILA
jgi:uncharacterized protein YggT (Ycf19 family)